METSCTEPAYPTFVSNTAHKPGAVLPKPLWPVAARLICGWIRLLSVRRRKAAVGARWPGMPRPSGNACPAAGRNEVVRMSYCGGVQLLGRDPPIGPAAGPPFVLPHRPACRTRPARPRALEWPRPPSPPLAAGGQDLAGLCAIAFAGVAC